MRDGAAHAPDGRTVGYGELVSALSLHVDGQARHVPRREGGSKVIGENLPRVDIPAKVSGGEAYVQDMRLPGMLHARVVRGPSDGTRLEAGRHRGGRAGCPASCKVVRDGRFIAVVADHEWRAVKALHRLQAAGWERAGEPLPAKRRPARGDPPAAGRRICRSSIIPARPRRPTRTRCAPATAGRS